MHDDEEPRLPVHLWIDAQLKPLNDRGVFYTVPQRGERNSGVILLKLDGLEGPCRLLIQQRDLDGKMGWMNALDKESVDVAEADAYIAREISRDPDLWVIEIEDRSMDNPFEGKTIE
jgi:hypothetical protein